MSKFFIQVEKEYLHAIINIVVYIFQKKIEQHFSAIVQIACLVYKCMSSTNGTYWVYNRKWRIDEKKTYQEYIKQIRSETVDEYERTIWKKKD